jgi:hypothetical protein
MHSGFDKATLLALAQQYHAPLIALAVAIVVTVVARVGRSLPAAIAASGIGTAVGWFLLGTRGFSLSPRTPADRLAMLATGAAILTVAATKVMPRVGPWPPRLVLALATGWWMGGAPLTQAGLIAAWPTGGGIAVAAGIALWLTSGAAADTLLLLCGTGTLAAALWLSGAPAIWPQFALVLAAASVPPVQWARLPGAASFTVATSLGALAASIGQVPHDAFRTIDAACLSSALALWLMPRIAFRLHRAGRAGPAIAALIAGGLAVAAVWGLMRWRGH